MEQRRISFQDGGENRNNQTRDPVGANNTQSNPNIPATPITTETETRSNVRGVVTSQTARFPTGYPALNMSEYGSWDSSLRSVRSESNLLEIHSVKQTSQKYSIVDPVSLQVQGLNQAQGIQRPESGQDTEPVTVRSSRQNLEETMSLPISRGNGVPNTQLFTFFDQYIGNIQRFISN